MSAVQITDEQLQRLDDDCDLATARTEAPAICCDGAGFSWGTDTMRAAIGFDLERGREDVARRYAGDDAVDQVIAEDLGITVEQLRTPGFLDGINGYESAT